MGDYPAGTITENGVTVEIFVDDRGDWTAEHAGRSFREKTRDDLKARIKVATKRTTRKVEVPFTFVSRHGTAGIKFWRGTATGIHSGNGNVLYTRTLRGTETKDQFTGRSSNEFIFGGVSDDVLKRLHQLVKDYAEADDALRTFESRYKIDLKDVVQAALDASE